MYLVIMIQYFKPLQFFLYIDELVITIVIDYCSICIMSFCYIKSHAIYLFTMFSLY